MTISVELIPVVGGGAAGGRPHRHDGPGVVSAAMDEATIRVLLLTATAVVAGVGLVAPFSRHPATAPRRVLSGVAAGLVVATGLPGLTGGQVLLGVLAVHIALAVGVPLLLDRPRLARAAGGGLLVLLCLEATFPHTGPARGIAILHVAAATVALGSTAAVATEAPGARFRLGRRLLPLVIASGAVLGVTGIAQARLSGLALDGRLVTTTFGMLVLGMAGVFVALGVLAIVLTVGLVRKGHARATGPRRQPGLVGTVRAATAGLVLAVAAGTALAAVPAPEPPPVPGAPLLRDVALGGDDLAVLVSPHRPGRNLVHLGGDRPTAVRVGLTPGDLRPVRDRPGATGGWVVVDLPAGRSRLLLERGGTQTSVALDTGAGGETPASATGQDGPECASAALGALVAGTSASTTVPPTPLRTCPADRLASEDAADLRATAAFLATRKPRTASVLADTSPRARTAEVLVRQTLQNAGVSVREYGEPSDLLVIVAGWSTAATELAKVTTHQDAAPAYPHGVHLAPWLLTGPVVRAAPGVVLPLRFNPHAPLPLSYANLLTRRFPGEAPTATGYLSWVAARPGGTPRIDTPGVDDQLRLYTASSVAFVPKEFSHDHGDAGWLPGGTVVPATGPLDVP